MVASELARYRRTAGWLGVPFHYLVETASTNDVVRREAERGASEGLVVLAEVQHAGRGRLKRRWSAPEGTSLLMSLLFRPGDPFAYHASRTTMICGLALVDAVVTVSGVPVRLKWPNDLIVEDEQGWRKVAGMLSETGGSGSYPDFLVVGVGLNVNIPADALPRLGPNATSLLVERGESVARVALLDTFLEGAEELCERLREGWDPLPEWRERLAWRGREVCVRTPVETVEGRMEEVDAEGALVLSLPDGSERRFPVGDVSLRARDPCVSRK